MSKPKIHFMSKEDCDKEEASRLKTTEPSKWYFGKVLCGADAWGVSPNPKQVNCKTCTGALRASVPKENEK